MRDNVSGYTAHLYSIKGHPMARQKGRQSGTHRIYHDYRCPTKRVSLPAGYKDTLLRPGNRGSRGALVDTGAKIPLDFPIRRIHTYTISDETPRVHLLPSVVDALCRAFKA